MFEPPTHHIKALLLARFPAVYKDHESLYQAVAEHREFDRKLTYVVTQQMLPALEGLDFASFNGLNNVKWLTARCLTEQHRQGLFDRYQGQSPWLFLQEADPKKRPLDKLLKEFPELAGDETEFQRLFIDLRDFEGRVRFLSIQSILHQRKQHFGCPALLPRPYTLADCVTSDELRKISAQLDYEFTSLEHHLLHLAFLMSLFLAEPDECQKEES